MQLRIASQSEMLSHQGGTCTSEGTVNNTGITMAGSPGAPCHGPTRRKKKIIPCVIIPRQERLIFVRKRPPLVYPLIQDRRLSVIRINHSKSYLWEKNVSFEKNRLRVLDL